MLKYVGFFLMLVDHITMIFFPDFLLGRIIGRLCAPIFFYELAIGYFRTKDFNKYLERMIMWAVISQVIIWLLVDFHLVPRLNILFTFALCLISLHFYHKYPQKFTRLAILFFSLWCAWFFPFDYGWYAVAGVFLFHFYQPTTEWKMLWITTTLLTVFDSSIGILEMFAVFAPILIFTVKDLDVKLPRLNFYAFYAGHWVILGLLANAITLP